MNVWVYGYPSIYSYVHVCGYNHEHKQTDICLYTHIVHMLLHICVHMTASSYIFICVDKYI